MIRYTWLLACSLLVAGCEAATNEEEVAQVARAELPASSASASTMLDRWNELMRKGREYAGEEKQNAQVRLVNRGAKPEILLEEEGIRVNGKHVDMGGALQSWKAALQGSPRCTSRKNGIALCVWDDLGIEVGTGVRDRTKVTFFNVHFQVPSPGGLEPVPTSSGREPPPARPRKAFPGYLQLDGFGIDAQTQFWEIRAKTKPERNLRCGLRDCSHPHGGYGDKASLYLRLNRSDDRGNVVEFSMDGGEEAAVQAAPPKGK